MLGTVTLKFGSRIQVLSNKNINFRTPHIISLASKLIDVLSHSGHRVTLALSKNLWYI